MGALARLKSLKGVERPPEDLTVAADGGTFGQPQILRLAPVPRGVIAPVSGHLSDPVVLRALMVSGDGWLNDDGRVIANGTRSPEDALASLPEMAAAFARIAELDTANTARVRKSYMAARADHEASGEPTEDFFFDANLVDTYYKDAEMDDAIGRARWFRIMLRRENGSRTVLCEAYGDYDDRIAEQLAALRRSLGFDTRPGRDRGPSTELDDEPVSTFRL